jgi:hypothetical protein
MIQAPRGTSLLQKTSEGGFVSLGRRREFLDGDRSIQMGVVGQIHDPKSPLAQDAYDAVFKELLVRDKWHGRFLRVIS